jgi:hypothetical protein
MLYHAAGNSNREMACLKARRHELPWIFYKYHQSTRDRNIFASQVAQATMSLPTKAKNWHQNIPTQKHQSDSDEAENCEVGCSQSSPTPENTAFLPMIHFTSNTNLQSSSKSPYSTTTCKFTWTLHPSPDFNKIPNGKPLLKFISKIWIWATKIMQTLLELNNVCWD